MPIHSASGLGVSCWYCILLYFKTYKATKLPSAHHRRSSGSVSQCTYYSLISWLEGAEEVEILKWISALAVICYKLKPCVPCCYI